VDQPVSVGFSVGNATAKNEDDIAADFIGFFNNFTDIFFGKSEFKVYVTGESYAGRYIPYISAAMLDEESSYSVGGALIYDGVIGALDTIQIDTVVFPFIEVHTEQFSYLNSTQISDLQSNYHSCGFDAYISEYLVFPPCDIQPPQPSMSNQSCKANNQASSYIYEANKCFTPFNINQTCPTPADPLMGATPYFNRDDVKAALHAPNITWSECAPFGVFDGIGGPTGQGDASPDPIQGALPKVIEATNRVLVANGDLDMAVITNGTLLSVQNMTWNGQLGLQTKPFEPINVDGQAAGVQRFERGFMWAETYNSGHMEPQMQPAVSYRHLQWLLGHIDTL
jgi:carboxypeptidase D